MLANLLAIIIGLASLAFYLAAFILPEVHRRSDFFWSGVGMFYAVVLWYCARQMNGAVLLGQTASVGLLLWLGYQTLRLRRVTTPAAQQTPIQLSKSERSRLADLRPLAKEYEFVEDGVKDAIDHDPDFDRPILIKPETDKFTPTMVVPAAIAKPKATATKPEETAEQSAPQKPPKQKQPNPLEAVGILAGWIKEVVTPKKQPPKPMIELPPRPPSIPKSDTAEAATGNTDIPTEQTTNAATPATKTIDETLTSQSSTPLDKPAVPSPVPTASEPDSEAVPLAEATQPQNSEEDSNWPDDEDTNWPDDEFWE